MRHSGKVECEPPERSETRWTDPVRALDAGARRPRRARVRHIMIQLAWRMLYHQPNATLVQWYRDRVAKANGAGRITLIVALARKLLIALWRFVQSCEVPEGTRLATV